MFNAFRFPYSDFNKLNLDWVMSKLPVDITAKCSVSESIDVTEFYACKFGDMVFIYIKGQALEDIASGDTIITLPVKSKFLQGFFDFAYMGPAEYTILTQNGFTTGDQFYCSFIAVTQGDE